MQNKLQGDNIVYNNEKFANTSELRLDENQNDLPDLVPTQANVSEGKGSENNLNENKKSEENGRESWNASSSREGEGGNNVVNGVDDAVGNGQAARLGDKPDDGSVQAGQPEPADKADGGKAGQPEPADKTDGGKAAVRKEGTPNPTQEPVREKRAKPKKEKPEAAESINPKTEMTGPKVANPMAANDEFLTSSDYIEKQIQQYVDENGLNLYDFEGSPEWKNLYNQYEKEYPSYLKAFIDSYDNASVTEKSVLDEKLNDAGVSIDEIRAYDGEKVRFHSPHRKLSPISQKLFQKFIDWLKATGLAKDFVIDEKAMREVLGRKGVEVFYQIAELSAVNARWNEELDNFKAGKLKGNLHLGNPLGILRASGVKAGEMNLAQPTLTKKLAEHNLTTDDLQNLAKAIQDPIMVYEWGTKAKSTVIVTELTTKDGRKITVAVRAENKGRNLEINEIASVHGKTAERFLSDMETAKEGGLSEALRYVQKEKAIDWLGLPRLSTNQGLSNSIAKVIENFENPKIEDENLSLPDGIKLMATSKGEIYGFVTKDGTIYIDPNLMNANTPMHELGHLWLDFIKNNNRELWNKGAELIKKSPYWEQIKDNPAYANLTKKQKIEEALAMAIGDRGEAMMQEALKGGDLSGFAKIRKWLNNVWNFIKRYFGIRSLSAEQIERLTLDDFLNGAVADLLSGEKITAKKTGAARAKEVESFLNETAEGQEITRQIAETRAKYTVPRTANSVSEAQKLIEPLANKTLHNETLGIDGVLSKKNIGKLGEEKATKQSINPRLHAKAVANIDKLFENAEFDVIHPDYKENKDIEQIHRLGTLMFDEKTNDYVPVMITVKEFKNNSGNKIYTVEAVDIEKIKNSAGRSSKNFGLESDSKEAQSPIAEFSVKVQQLYESAIANEEKSKILFHMDVGGYYLAESENELADRIKYISKNTGITFTKSKNTNSWYGEYKGKKIRISDHFSKFEEKSNNVEKTVKLTPKKRLKVTPGS